jgi:hypothetical protein
VDIDDKNNDRFMIGLSTKLQENNIIIADDAIRTHMEANKRMDVAAPSGSAPPRYGTVYHHGPTYPPH